MDEADGNQPLMPSQQRARADDAGDLFELLQTDTLGLGGQSSALVVIEPGLVAQLLPEDLDLLLEVFDRVLLIAVDPAGQTDEEQLKMVHPGRIGGGLQFGQGFCYGEAYTCVDRRILVSSKRKREFLDSSGPSGLDKQYAHKIALVFNPKDETFYMFYNAVPGQKGAITGGRGIGLITSKALPGTRGGEDRP